MAPRAYWKGYLRLSLVSCPIELFPATTEREKVRFHQINRKTGHRIKYLKVDAETEKPVDGDDIVKGYEVGKGEYIEVTEEELDAIALESTKTIDIHAFVPKDEIDSLYNIRPYYIAPDGKAGAEAFAVIREAFADMDMVALGRVVLTSREHVMALEPRGPGLMGTLLRVPYEIRDETTYFDDLPKARVTKDMLELARHIISTKKGHFEPKKFEDHYERALRELIAKKRKGEHIEAPQTREPAKVINLMDALRRSVEAEGGRARTAPSQGRAPAKRAASHSRRSAPRHRKAG